MLDRLEHHGQCWEVLLDAELGAPGRVLDLFTAQNWLPQGFAFCRCNEILRLNIVVGHMPARSLAILLAKLRRIEGVRCVKEHGTVSSVVALQ